MVNIFSIERSSQESHGFSHERFKDNIETVNKYIISLFEVDEEDNVLKFLEKYESNNINSVINKVKDIENRYVDVEVISEDRKFNLLYSVNEGDF